MNSTMVWVITEMLWYQGPGDYGHTDYEAKQFNGRGECLDYIWDNKALLVEELFRIHGCLLYTSPSPRDRTRSRMPSSA